MAIISKEELLKSVKYDNNGLVAVIAQDYHSKKVRMMAYMNGEALKKTLDTKKVTYFSRSRQSLWVKGETSGYFQYLKGISIDCDGDALLIQIEQVGGISCHTGNSTCFYREIDEDMEITINRENKISDDNVLGGLLETVKDRKVNPKEGSYTNYLIDKGMNKILKKVGEEATETVIAAKDATNNSELKNSVVFEISDLMYHLTVMMEELDISWDDIYDELKKR